MKSRWRGRVGGRELRGERKEKEEKEDGEGELRQRWRQHARHNEVKRGGGRRGGDN